MKQIIANFLTTMFVVLVNYNTNAQADMSLTIPELLSWTQTGNGDNVSNTPIAPRVKSPNYQINQGLDTNTRLLYSPDGMNNFGPYKDSANQFNLFNFSHWQYIDILAWFGGSASEPILIPSKSWVDAAHKNGVKVIGTIFFAPIVYGGSQAQVQNFLQTDASGNFIAAQKMIEIANFYHFDGWILNCETTVNSATGALVASFVNKLDSAYTGELIWYDSMLQNGNISYQNRLNANNAYFFTRSTGLFTNYNWTQATTVANSANYATSISQSPFKVYTGADMWPNRNAQPAFSNYQWIDKIITANVAKTSIAAFATNFTFNYAPFSNFNNDSTDYLSFYAAERKIFSGVDKNPFATDATWKGFSNYIPVRTTINSLPFETEFNTGHGLNYYNNGGIVKPGSWHNMAHQSILPSWTFYAAGVNMEYDFNDAYAGGSSIKITSASAGAYQIPLYSTAIKTNTNSLNIGLALKTISTSIDSITIELKTKSGINIISRIVATNSVTWQNIINSNVLANANDTIIAISLNIYSSGAFDMNIGKLTVQNGNTNAISESINSNSFLVYPNPSNGMVNIKFDSKTDDISSLRIFDLKGSLLLDKVVKNGEIEQVILPANGIYMYELNAAHHNNTGRIIIE